ncbi:hypothetical protein ZICARI_233 [Candidatus Zinderia insecticola CARI]|uniref:Uncharacterized protein n=1 Tax=Zinderia insecticola (strain CARI) TaxID=871271 RepID=E4PYU4_ZINIC|nr:hypothetical protein ZICARI_233 [Candidatus Zinderia insecticola CARI]
MKKKNINKYFPKKENILLIYKENIKSLINNIKIKDFNLNKSILKSIYKIKFYKYINQLFLIYIKNKNKINYKFKFFLINIIFKIINFNINLINKINIINFNNILYNKNLIIKI